jgi:hypothetical protein
MCFCKILRCWWFSGFTDSFFLREIHRICPRDCGPGPPASAHGSTGFIKHRPLIQRSTSKIYHREGISQLLISIVHHRSDGWGGWLQPWAARARAHDGAPRPSVVAHRCSSFHKPWWCHTRLLCQNRVLIVFMTQDHLFHTYGQKCSQITKCHKTEYNYYINNVF